MTVSPRGHVRGPDLGRARHRDAVHGEFHLVGRDVVHDGVPEDVVERVRRSDVLAAPSDHRRQFAFGNGRAVVVPHLDGLAVSQKRRGGLEKKVGYPGVIVRRLHQRPIVEGHTEDFAGAGLHRKPVQPIRVRGFTSNSGKEFRRSPCHVPFRLPGIDEGLNGCRWSRQAGHGIEFPQRGRTASASVNDHGFPTVKENGAEFHRFEFRAAHRFRRVSDLRTGIDVTRPGGTTRRTNRGHGTHGRCESKNFGHGS